MLHLFTLGHNERLVDGKIDLKIMINGEYKNEFKFLGIKSNIEGKVDFKLDGGAGLKLRYGTSPQKSLFMELILIFSGVKGTFSGKIKAKNDLFGKTEKKLNPFHLPCYTASVKYIYLTLTLNP